MTSVPHGTHAEAGQQTASTSRGLDTTFWKAWTETTAYRPHTMLIRSFEAETGPVSHKQYDKLGMTLGFVDVEVKPLVDIDGDKQADWVSRNQDELSRFKEDFGRLLRRVFTKIYSEYTSLIKQVPDLVHDNCELTDDESSASTDHDGLGTIHNEPIGNKTSLIRRDSGSYLTRRGSCYAEWARLALPDDSDVVERQWRLEIWFQPAMSSQHTEVSQPISPTRSEPPNTSYP